MLVPCSHDNMYLAFRSWHCRACLKNGVIQTFKYNKNKKSFTNHFDLRCQYTPRHSEGDTTVSMRQAGLRQYMAPRTGFFFGAVANLQVPGSETAFPSYNTLLDKVQQCNLQDSDLLLFRQRVVEVLDGITGKLVPKVSLDARQSQSQLA